MTEARLSTSTFSGSSKVGDHKISTAVVGYMGHTGFQWKAWDRNYVDPHARPTPKEFAPHVSTYAGHRPLNWDPSLRQHAQQDGVRANSAPAVKKKARAMKTASDGTGMWYGHIGQFPNAVDGWSPAHRSAA
mmetsp:Transcript_27319/g.43775  ORF Transcript_27319/g.43775 Transcript_27319/m.43775 type:complete len:132 (-) Transcript_27319:81-476(-)|eukprot:CAMPEP_0169269562 /NCGR_PEP_ID=MMETSP1016-20121227/48529_1 /TAXON_ID=342587 /ORGANISM="Karlodinium micrum, Strain CCMP2283" /LENGTH=131 /DNA_ID=CAMNT_0009354607 /DNA_START=22 /DNA_END=417 /DNA_ORIENTATION=+